MGAISTRGTSEKRLHVQTDLSPANLDRRDRAVFVILDLAQSDRSVPDVLACAKHRQLRATW